MGRLQKDWTLKAHFSYKFYVDSARGPFYKVPISRTSPHNSFSTSMEWCSEISPSQTVHFELSFRGFATHKKVLGKFRFLCLPPTPPAHDNEGSFQFPQETRSEPHPGQYPSAGWPIPPKPGRLIRPPSSPESTKSRNEEMERLGWRNKAVRSL